MVLSNFSSRISFQLQRFFAKDSTPKMKYLCVAEKNDAAKNIASILSRGNSNRREGLSKYNKIYTFSCQINGAEAECIMTSVSGHLLTHAFSGIHKMWNQCNPIDLFDAPVQKICPQDSEKIKRTIQKELRSCQALIIWTDCDREGENIGFEIIQVCQEIRPNIDVFRAKFSEITGRSIARAINNLERPNRNVSVAVDVRSELDLRTGAAFTRLQTLRLQKVFPDVLEQKLISYGSCQFPTLGFVVERFKAIENFIAEQFWQIHLSHTIKQLTTDFTWKRNRLFEKPAVLAILDICQQANTARIESVESKAKSKWRPVPLDTIEMEKIISRKMRLSAKETMKIAEKLYTSGFISYPRTETNIFPKEMNLANIVQQQLQDPSWGQFANRIMNEGGPTPRQGKKSDQAHPPIHPTKYADGLTGNEKRVYEFIVRHFLACVHKDAKGHETVVQADCGGETFTAKGLVILERNYLDVYIYENWNGKEIHEYQVGDCFVPTRLEMGEGVTSPPKLLTEADLIALMEKHGIGTDATHAEHIETIKSREYVSLQQNIYFVPAALGMGLVEGYNNMELQISLAKPNLRSDLENDLKLICEGRKQAEDVRRDQIAIYREVYRTVADKMAAIDGSLRQRLNREPRPYNDDLTRRPTEKSVLKCPKCGKDMFLRQRTNGTGWYLGCSNFPQCKNAAWFSGVSNAQVIDESCAVCGPDVRKIKFTFRQNPFLGEPNPNVLCIGGCDPAVIAGLDIDISSVKKVNTTPNRPPQVQNAQNNHGTPPAPPPPAGPKTRTNKTKTKQLPPNQSMLTHWIGGGATNNQNTSIGNDSHNSRPCSGSTSTSTSQNTNNFNNHDPNDQRAADTQICNCNKSATVLTCRNGANAGRKFYKCPNNTLSGGGCGYFLWKDDETETTANQTNHNTSFNVNARQQTWNNHNQNGNDSGDDDNPQCQCGLPAVVRTVNKDGPNKGRQFRGCSKPMGQTCKFFEWTDEDQDTSSRKRPKFYGKKRGGDSTSTNAGGTKRAKRKCGLCHQEGHTRAKCPNNAMTDD